MSGYQDSNLGPPAPKAKKASQLRPLIIFILLIIKAIC